MGEGLAKKGINERKRQIGKENVKNSDKKKIHVCGHCQSTGKYINRKYIFN